MYEKPIKLNWNERKQNGLVFLHMVLVKLKLGSLR